MSDGSEGREGALGSAERETGIVEKLLSTYGFIRCCDRQARLFFHYSQFSGTVEHLKVGDAVDFEMTFDKKSGKPIAVAVAKLCSDPTLGMGHQLVQGVVTSELNSEGREGRVAYENCGECFFFEFTRDDLDPAGETPTHGQTVQFVITADGAGNLQAGQVRPLTAHAQTPAALGAPHLGPQHQQVPQQQQYAIATPMVGTVYPGGVVLPVATIHATQMPLLGHPHAHQVPVTVTPFPPHGAQVIHVVNGTQPAPMVNSRMLTGLNGNLRDSGIEQAIPQATGVVKSVQQPQQTAVVAQAHTTSTSQAAAASTQQHFSGQSTKHHQQQQQQQQQNIHQGGAAGGGGQTSNNQNTSHQQTHQVQQQHTQQSQQQQAQQQQQNQKQPQQQQPQQQQPQQQQQQVAASGSPSPQKAPKGKRGPRGGEAQDDDAQQANGNSGGRYQGVVCTLKETYGFVERADVVKEIFFHYTEGYQGISLGDDVSFDISMRNNREVAVNLQRLPSGTVVFEDLENCIRRGWISKLPNQTEEPLDGRVKYEDNGGTEKEVGFGDRDLAPLMWTVQVGDPVDFQLATDRRDGLKRATNITMAVTAPTAFAKENRLSGTVVALKENFGFVNSEQGNVEYYFKLSEVLDQEIRIDTTVQFSLAADHNGQRQVAIRLCKVPTPGGQTQSNKKKTNSKNASVNNSAKFTHRGYIVALKEQFGFIEAENRQEDLFFHYSIFEGDTKDMNVGREVEYGLSTKNQRQCADCVRPLERNTVPGIELVSKDVYAGKVVRSLRCFNPDQEPYCGLVQLKPSPEEAKETDEADPNANGDSDTNSKETPAEYEFSVMSLSKKGEVVHKGNSVSFQLAVCKVTQKVMAVNVKAVRERKTGTLGSLKGQFGYLNYEAEKGAEPKKLMFSLSEVRNGSNLQVGDILEFDLVRTGRNNKQVAMNVNRIKEKGKGATPRPAALVNRIKAMTLSDDGPRVIAIRAPKGPDGSRGFALSSAAAVPAVA